jgi:hypothetical protein
VVLRVGLIIVCAAAIVFGAVRLHQDDSCEHTRTALLSALFHRTTPAGGFAHQERRLIDTCRDRDVLTAVAVVEQRLGSPSRAAALARVVVTDEPRNARGWAVLAQAVAHDDPRAAAAARARLRALAPPQS